MSRDLEILVPLQLIRLLAKSPLSMERQSSLQRGIDIFFYIFNNIVLRNIRSQDEQISDRHKANNMLIKNVDIIAINEVLARSWLSERPSF
ncbi:hypothetical protein Bpfe_005866 [Biomphalaria pfeifferi]|uniref:Uncharacterized protein n=1 Tax=Biomphalaria pfeifferi TaxID=112525 RepID=A0AAD8C2Y3_BIOPF|nr:hypothetical protein Bpfe_005866 [Biomphalaria pfeifferi]